MKKISAAFGVMLGIVFGFSAGFMRGRVSEYMLGKDARLPLYKQVGHHDTNYLAVSMNKNTLAEELGISEERSLDIHRQVRILNSSCTQCATLNEKTVSQCWSAWFNAMAQVPRNKTEAVYMNLAFINPYQPLTIPHHEP